jgi:hypothetical protein
VRVGLLDLRSEAVFASALKSDIHEEAFVNAEGKTSTGLPKHPFGIIR